MSHIDVMGKSIPEKWEWLVVQQGGQCVCVMSGGREGIQGYSSNWGGGKGGN